MRNQRVEDKLSTQDIKTGITDVYVFHPWNLEEQNADKKVKDEPWEAKWPSRLFNISSNDKTTLQTSPSGEFFLHLVRIEEAKWVRRSREERETVLKKEKNHHVLVFDGPVRDRERLPISLCNAFRRGPSYKPCTRCLCLLESWHITC